MAVAGVGGNCQALLERRSLRDQPLGRMGRGWPLSLSSALPLLCVIASPHFPCNQECTCVNSGEGSRLSAPHFTGWSMGTVCDLCTCCSSHLECTSSSSPSRSNTSPGKTSVPPRAKPECICCAPGSHVLLLVQHFTHKEAVSSSRAGLCLGHRLVPGHSKEPVHGKNVVD